MRGLQRPYPTPWAMPSRPYARTKGKINEPKGAWYYVNERARVYADFCLHLTSCAGIMTSKDAVARLQVHAQEEKARLGVILQDAGFLVAGVKKRSKVQAYLQNLHDMEGVQLRYTEFKYDKKKSTEQNARPTSNHRSSRTRMPAWRPMTPCWTHSRSM